MEYKKCALCGKVKPITQFGKKGKRNFPRCKECRHVEYLRSREKNIQRAHKYLIKNHEKVLQQERARRDANAAKEILRSARDRAKAKGREFNLDLSDIVVPEKCPVLGIKLAHGKGHTSPNSPSIDRIDSTKGYIKGNVIIVSYLANTIKTNATVEQIKKVADFYENLEKYRNQ